MRHLQMVDQHPCGYAPRVLQYWQPDSESDEPGRVLFVGSKDGSVTVVRPVRRDDRIRFDAIRLLLGTRGSGNAAGVRAILPFGETRLIVGRNDGSVDLLQWRQDRRSPVNLVHRDSFEPPARPAPNSRAVAAGGESVRYAAWLDQDRLLLSYRHAGTRVVKLRATDQPGQFRRQLRSSQPLGRKTDGLGGVWLAAPMGLAAPGPRRVLLVDQRGRLWHWCWQPGSTAEPPTILFEDSWSGELAPALIEDVAPIASAYPDRARRAQEIRGLILTADTGVFAIDLRHAWSASETPPPCRLALSGAGSQGMAVTYVEQAGSGYLWLAARDGSCHLFQNDPLDPDTDFRSWALGFRRSGEIHADAQVLVAHAWSDTGTIWLATACRDDQVRIYDHKPAEAGTSDRPGDGADRKTSGEIWAMLAGTPNPSEDIVVEALRSFVDGHRLNPKEPAADPARPPYALFAQAIEILADRHDPCLFEFLSAPQTWVANALLSASAETRDAGEPGRPFFERAIDLWTLCLVGLVNLQPEPREEWYLGILRFLRGLAPPPAHATEEFQQAIDKGIRFATKWGLYGEVNRIRQDLVVPLQILQHKAPQGGGDDVQEEVGSAALDALSYSVLLFRRSYSVVAEDMARRQKGTTGKAVSTLKIAGGTVIAVAWNRSGIYLGLLADQQTDEARPPELKSITPEALGSLLPAQEDSQYRYGRSVLLLSPGEVLHCDGAERDDDFFLLAASREDPVEKLTLYHLGLDHNEKRYVVKAQFSLPEASNRGRDGELNQEAIYHLIKLGRGLVAAGIDGTRGKTNLALFEISARRSPRKIELPNTQPPVPMAAEDLARNRAFSLALVGRVKAVAGGGRRAVLLAGCENGDIWRVAITLIGDKAKTKTDLIASLASPVTALACRHVTDAGPGAGQLRIFAGAQDGTVLCLQQVAPQPDSPFATLWATAEQAPITAIDRHEYRPAKKEDGEPFTMVLAVARNGYCVALDDRDKMEASPPPPAEGSRKPSRSPIPGIRRFRTHFAESSFAAAAFEHSWNPQRAWRFLATASGTGEVRVVSLHLPRYTVERRDRFKKLLGRLWHLILAGNGKPEHLRTIEALYRAAPLFLLIPVRWLLDPDHQQTGNRLKELEGLAEWWWPRSLQPLRQLHLTWSQNPPNPQEVNLRLRDLLRTAWRLGDSSLFQEICTVVLKRINQELYRGGDAKLLKQLYFNVIKAIEASLALWLGGSEEMPTRSEVAKNLVDGDTYWRLVDRVVRNPRSPWLAILEKRIEGVRQLVFKDDVLVSIEALRAANRSMLQLCRRLADARRQEDAEDKLIAVPWDQFKLYFQRLTGGAARALQPKLRMSDIFYGEYARTFALCLCACPAGVVPMINHLTEAHLIVEPLSANDLATRITRQLSLVRSTFQVSSLDGIEAILEQILQPNLDNLDPPAWFAKTFTKRSGWQAKLLDQIGLDLAALDQVYEPVRQLRDLAGKLSDDARDLDFLSHDRIDRLRKRIDRSTARSELYRHSANFWVSALADLAKAVGSDVGRPSDKIRPEIVLLSHSLAQWASDTEKKLLRCYQDGQIFQPEHALFGELLQRFRRAADGFALGAAVQKNLVVGILGHHLLEDLDLHVFELREIARNLDPLGVAGGAPAAPPDVDPAVGSRFASLLVHRAQRALSLPKNLRALAYVLQRMERKQSEHLRDIVELVAGSDAWIFPKDGGKPPLAANASALLALVVRELHENHLHHSGIADSVRSARSRPSVSFVPNGFRISFPVNVRSADGKIRWDRLKQVQVERLQRPLSPSTDQRIASTGVGLYLSSLAAAMAGWRLSMEPLAERTATDSRRRLTFKLQQLHPAGGAQRAAGPARPVSAAEVTGQDIHDVVVIDDKAAVALYLWREAGGVTGFGSATMEAAEARKWFQKPDGMPAAIKAPDGGTNFWWVCANSFWKRSLEKVLKEIGSIERSLFLIDVRGPLENEGKHRYKATKVLEFLKGEGVDERHQIRLISSYEQGIFDQVELPKTIKAKTPETFVSMVAPPRNLARQPVESLHVLVSGAGFELAERPQQPIDQHTSMRLGIPATADLLKRWINASDQGPVRYSKGAYPMPEGLYAWLARKHIKRPGYDLDRYWDLLLRWATEATDAKAAEREEHRLRDSFRQQFQLDDWGYLGQALAAAELPWTAWLSTNYTRFANRAIERVQPPAAGRRAQGAWAPDGAWRTVEIQEEAERLQREILFDNMASQRERLLFKLHGDIGHTLTMALAGDDKTMRTRVQCFATLYLAARSYLLERARLSAGAPGSERRSWVWHIVGHGLRDRLLVELITAVVKGSKDRTKHHFVVVDLSTQPAKLLALKLHNRESRIEHWRMTAEVYLSRLRRHGLDRYQECRP